MMSFSLHSFESCQSHYVHPFQKWLQMPGCRAVQPHMYSHTLALRYVETRLIYGPKQGPETCGIRQAMELMVHMSSFLQKVF